MSIAQLQSFLKYLRDMELLSQAEIVRGVKRMQQQDRRIGQMGMVRGFFKPEDVSKVMLAQTQLNMKFGEIAIELGYITKEQCEELARIQKDDTFSFCQAIVIMRIKSMPDMVSYLKEFLKTHPVSKSATAYDEDHIGKLDAELRQVLIKIKGVAPLPNVVSKVLEQLNDPDVSMEDIGKVIAIDPGLTTTLLRIVNSAFYGLRSSADSLTQALVVLGAKKIRELITVAGIVEKFKNLPRSVVNRFWEGSIYAGQWSKEVATFLKLPDVDSMFINGFVHNVGELVIMQSFPRELKQIHEMIQSGTPKVVAERQVLGGTHADISSFLFEIWKFPGMMVQSAMLHETPLENVVKMNSISREALIVHMAASITKIDMKLDAYEYAEQLEDIINNYEKVLPLGDIQIEDTIDSVQLTASELRDMLSLGA